MPIIQTEDLTYTYGPNTPFQRTALHSVSLSIEEGAFLGVIGHTGSGKSTFIQHLNGLLKPASGRVYIDGVDLASSKEAALNARFQVGLLFQYPEYQLFDETVSQDIAFGPRNMGLSEAEVEARVHDAAGFVGLEEALLSKSPFELSGGEKRRAAIAGVMAMRPRVLILDEPTAGLDPRGQEQILDNILTYKRETGATVIMVTHSMEEIARLADTIAVFKSGQIVMEGTPADIFAQGDALRDLGLAVPAVTRIAMRLAELGRPIGPCYTVEQAVSAIMTLERGRPDA